MVILVGVLLQLLIWLTVLTSVTEQVVPTYRGWPLSSDFASITTPKSYDCFNRTYGNQFSFNGNGYDVLEYDENRRSYVDINSNEPTLVFKNFTISLYVYTRNDSGTLLHYQGKNYFYHHISEIKVVVKKSMITAVICWIDGNGIGFDQAIDHPSPLPMNQWILVNLARNIHGQGLFDMNNVRHLFTIYPSWLSFNAYLRLGSTLNNTRGEFSGRLGCLTIAESPYPVMDMFDVCYNGTPEYGFRTCFGVEAKFVWPLNNQSFGYEAVTGSPPVEAPWRYNWVFDDFANALNQPSAIVFNSGVFLQLQAPLDWDMYRRYSIAMFLKLDNSNGATLMRVEQPPGGCFNAMNVTIGQGRIRVILSLNQNTAETSLLINPVNAWHFLAVQFNCDWKELSMIVDNQYNYTAFTFPYQGNQTSLQYLTMSVSNRFPPDFGGRISCLTLFNTPLDELDAQTRLLAVCNQHDSFVAPGEGDPSPTFLWPLNVNSYDYEVHSNVTTTYSPAKQCWRFNDQVGNVVNSGAAQFYASDKFSLVFNVLILITDEFSAGVFVKPDVNTTGTIMEAGLATTNNNYTARLTINVGQLTVQVISGSICRTQSVDIAQDNWSSVIVQHQANPAGMELVVNSVEHPIDDICSETQQATTGELRLGKSEAGGLDDDFHGQLRCLSLFDVSLDGQKGANIILAACSSSVDQNFVIPLGNPPAVSEMWRLDASDGLPEKGLSDMELLTSNSSLSFDGSSLLLVLINMTISQQPDIAVGFFIRPSKYNTGTVLTAEDENSTLVFTITMDTTSLSIDFYTSGESQCSSVLFTGVEADTWHHVFIQRIASCQLVMMVDDEKQYSSAQCLPSDQLSMLRVRLGGEQGSLNNFRGQLSCLLLFTSQLNDENIRNVMVNSCNNQTKVKVVGADDEYRSSNFTYTHYRLIQSRSAPYPLYFDLLRNVTVRSVSHCGRMCTSNQSCRSFTVDTTNSQTSCSLYNFITTPHGLIATEGVKYYGLVYIESAESLR